MMYDISEMAIRVLPCGSVDILDLVTGRMTVRCQSWELAARWCADRCLDISAIEVRA